MEQDCSFHGGQEGRRGSEEQRKWEEERKGREMSTDRQNYPSKVHPLWSTSSNYSLPPKVPITPKWAI